MAYEYTRENNLYYDVAYLIEYFAELVEFIQKNSMKPTRQAYS